MKALNQQYFKWTKDCKGRPIKKFEDGCRCSLCGGKTGLFKKVCPSCGAEIDRSTHIKVEVKEFE